jgi:UDP-GlcNAc:undecaprenyl-phosphate GlcNAc-1-phosphate transferase
LVPYLVVFGAAAVATFATTPLVRWVSLRVGWIDRPSDRKVHPNPTPTAGGLAILLGIVTGLAVSRLVPFLRGLHETTSEPDAALLAALAIVLVGLIDDVKGLSAAGKLVGQVLAAGILVLAGVQLLYFYLPIGGIGILSLSPDMAVPLTVVWVVATVNAVNLVDGLDGLAAGMVAIAAMAFFAYMYRAPGVDGAPSTAALLSALVAGASVGFLPWNFHPARIFMGDSGAMLLGLMMAAASISGVGRNQSPTGGDFAAVAIPIAVPLIILAVPFLDVVLAIVRRVRRGAGITHADKEHIHHRLLDIGHSHRKAVLLMYLWSALISACALAVAFINGRMLVGGIVAVAVILAAAIPRIVMRRPAGVPIRRVRGDGQIEAGLSLDHGPARTPIPSPEPPAAPHQGS